MARCPLPVGRLRMTAAAAALVGPTMMRENSERIPRSAVAVVVSLLARLNLSPGREWCECLTLRARY